MNCFLIDQQNKSLNTMQKLCRYSVLWEKTQQTFLLTSGLLLSLSKHMKIKLLGQS